MIRKKDIESSAAAGHYVEQASGDDLPAITELMAKARRYGLSHGLGFAQIPHAYLSGLLDSPTHVLNSGAPTHD